MSIKSALIAAAIGFSALAGTTAAQAAPLGAPALTGERAVTQVDYYRKNADRIVTHKMRRPYGYTHYDAPYEKTCYKKKIRIWSEHYGWVYKYKTVCHHDYH